MEPALELLRQSACVGPVIADASRKSDEDLLRAGKDEDLIDEPLTSPVGSSNPETADRLMKAAARLFCVRGAMLKRDNLEIASEQTEKAKEIFLAFDTATKLDATRDEYFVEAALSFLRATNASSATEIKYLTFITKKMAALGRRVSGTASARAIAFVAGAK